MKKLLAEIRSQPQHIREIFMWSSVVITFSFIGYFWLGSIGHDFSVALNPQKAEAERALALQKKSEKTPSIFGTLGDTLSNATANISGLFGGSNKEVRIAGGKSEGSGSATAHLFPISKDKTQ